MAEGSDSRPSSEPSGPQVWENVYAEGRQLNRYPFDSVVSFVFTNAPEKPRSDTRILEVGCGAGNNLWFAAREGFAVTGFDGSATAIDYARRRFATEGLEGDFRVLNFGPLPFPDASFDLAIDREALTCASSAIAEETLREVRRVLRPAGRLLSVVRSARDSAGSGSDRDQQLSAWRSAAAERGVRRHDRAQVSALFSSGWILRSVHHVEERSDSGEDVFAEWRVVAERI